MKIENDKVCDAETENYLRKKINNYSKSEIVDGLFRKFDYMTLDNLAHICECLKMQNDAEQKNLEREKKSREMQSAIIEYNQLVTELNTKGFENFPLDKVKRMSKLLKIIRS